MGNFADTPHEDFEAYDAARRRLRSKVWAERYRISTVWTESMEMSSPLLDDHATDQELLNDGVSRFGFGGF